MVFDKNKLKDILAENDVKTTEDLQVFMREMMKEVIETLYEGELEAHLGYKKHEQNASESGNNRNGHSSKKVKSHVGEMELEVPRDRLSTFSPEIVKKRQTDISGIEAKVISMYAKGMSNRDIKEHIYEIYGHEISPETVSVITDKILPQAKECQNRALEEIYAIVFMDGMVLKMRVDGAVRNVTIYFVIGISLEGHKSCLGLYLAETESAKYWLSVMNELKNRGVQDILIFAVDNLKGISEAINAAFPQSEIQKCVVHQIRNSLRFVPWKERKTVASDLKKIYAAATEEQARSELDAFAEKWDSKYPNISKSWRNNWTELSTYFKYSKELRKLIYTTNPVESFHSAIRKSTKGKGAFPTEDSLIKLLYLAILGIEKKWTMPIRDWGVIYSQLYINYEDRITTLHT